MFRQVAALVALLGCKPVTEAHLAPISPANVRAWTQHVDTYGGTHLTVSSRGNAGSHESWFADVDVRELADGCRTYTSTTPPISLTTANQFYAFAKTQGPGVPCYLVDPSLTWKTVQDTTRTVPDGARILRDSLAIAAAGALVYGNYECFGPGCSTGAKVAVGIGDGVVVLGAIAVVVAVAILIHHQD